MRAVLTILMALVTISVSAQTKSSDKVAPKDSTAVVTTPAVVAQEVTQVEIAQPEVAQADSLSIKAEEAPVVYSRATVKIHTHGDAGPILQKMLYSGPKKVKGFRILIYSGSHTTARNEASSVRARCTKLFQKLPVYMFYENPYFKVAVGNFRTKDEAQTQLKRVAKEFPKAFIVHEEINVKEFAK